MNEDYYEILQVHPHADQEAIAAAYARLRDLYDPARLDGAADELANLARQKRDTIERAYAVLGDTVRRATYDAEVAARSNGAAHEPAAGQRPASQSAILDYRPLPPARRAERARGFEAQPVRLAGAGRQSQPAKPVARRWVAPAVLAGLFVVIIAISVALTGGGGPPAPPAAPTPSAFDEFEARIPQAQQTAQQNPNDPRAWIDYGDTLYNSAEIARENAPDSPIYQQRLPRWLAATQAYTRALALDPSNAATRADLGVSACFYGAGTGDQSFVRSGTAEARRAAQAAPDDPRVLLNLGHCLVSAQPAQTQEAVENWRHVVQVAPPGSPFAAQAQQLIAKYDH